MKQPLMLDLCCGRGGWSKGFAPKDPSRQQRRMITRTSLRPSRPGHPRRKPKGYSAPARSAQGRAPARSLDSSNHLATSSPFSCYDYLRQSDNPKWDKYEQSCFWQSKLLKTLEDVIRSLEARKERMELILFSEGYEGEHGKTEQWLKRHPLMDSRLQKLHLRTLKHIERRTKDHKRLSHCQSCWVGFKPKCCTGRAIAVPIGCNHRLCFLCNGRRCEKFRERVRKLFVRLHHPAFLTLTVPNIPLGSLRKRVYSDFRKKWNKLRKRWAGYMVGGFFSFETTFNNSPDSPSYRTWHVHAHVMLDGSTALPVCKCPIRRIDGKSRKLHVSDCSFIALKRRLEFDWLCLTQGARGADGWRFADFDYWFARTIATNWKDASARQEWNRTNRRTVDIRRVTDRKKAAFETLKYATKGAHFCGTAEAVNEFIDATKGARMLQTFGSWYGFDFDDDVNTWAHLECGCGVNDFERIGTFFREGVEMDAAGQWHPKACCTGPPGQV